MADSQADEHTQASEHGAAAWEPVTPEELYLSGLFDGVWYQERYPDVGDRDALLHFLAVGDAEGRSPSERFDSTWYVAQIDGDLAATTGAVHHYLRVGAQAGLAIMPTPEDMDAQDVLVDDDPEEASEVDAADTLKEAVASENPAVATADEMEKEATEPSDSEPWPPLTDLEIYHSGLFNAEWYLDHHPELVGQIDALSHFVERGDALGWSPSRLFDSAWYLSQDKDLEGASGPVMHYLRRGMAEGRTPLPPGPLTALLAASPIFDEAWYRTQHPEVADQTVSALSYFLTEGAHRDHDPGPFFSSVWYRDQYAGRIPVTSPALEHYVREGEAAGLWPNAGFDPQAFERFRPSGDRDGQLDRYLIHAETSGSWDHPGFDSGFYIQDNPDLDLDGSSRQAAEHFARIGWREARAPTADLDRREPAPAGLLSFDILIDGYQADPRLIEATLDSLAAQSQGVWRAWISVEPAVRAAVAVPKSVAARVTTVAATPNRAVRLQHMLDHSRAEYLIILDAGDCLSKGALGKVARRLRHDRRDVLYSDEQRAGPTPREPAVVLKPDWSPELLTEFNYFGRLTALRAETVRRVGGFRTAAGEAAEWDLALRIGDADARIARLTEILCTRSATTDLDRPTEASRRAVDFRTVLTRYWRDKGLDPHVETRRDGTLDARWPLDAPPRVSVIIPTRDRPELLRRVIEGLIEGTHYPDLEIIVVNNLSETPDGLAYLETLENAGLRVVAFEEAFNYSAACNAGAAAATGQLLLFLNNDVEVIARDWIQELVRMAGRPGVGVVGAMLMYPGGELQHAGVAVGIDLAGLMFRGCGVDEWTVFGSPSVARNCLAIMGACQMVRRDVFDLVGGFDETYRIANSDVALCLRAWQSGYRTAYAPGAALLHHEGATRGRSNPAEDTLRMALDIRAMGLTQDPFFHPALDATVSAPTLRSGGAPDGRTNLAHAISRVLAAAPRADRLNPANIGEVAEAVGRPADWIKWSPHPREAVDDLWSAARFVIDTLLNRPELFRIYPKAVTAGPAGDFATWLLADAAERRGFDRRALDGLRKVFSGGLADRPTAAFRADSEFRAASPLGLTPAGLKAALNWLFNVGAARYDLRREEIWWWAFCVIEQAETSLAYLWRVTPEWQTRIPDGLNPTGAEALASWLGQIFDLDETWVRPDRIAATLPLADRVRLAYQAREAWRRRHPSALASAKTASAFLSSLAEDDRDRRLIHGVTAGQMKTLAASLAGPGVNLIGRFEPSQGRAGLAALSSSLASAGVTVAERAQAVVGQTATWEPAPARVDLELHDVTLIDIRPGETIQQAYARCDLKPRSARPYRIAWWDPVHDLAPSAWSETAGAVDEVWTSTQAAADRIGQRVGIPVHVLPPGIDVGAESRTELRGAEQGPFTFMTLAGDECDRARRNVSDTIAAFAAAFSGSDDARLIVDASRMKSARLVEALRQAAGAANVEILTAQTPQAARSQLYAAADAHVSLPRTSGLDMDLLQAMAAGKAIVTLAHSGNLDVVSDTTAILVDFTMAAVPVETEGYVAGSTWAIASIASAAAAMRALASDRKRASTIRAEAQDHVRRQWSVETRGRAMADRVTEIASGRVTPPPTRKA